MCDQCAELDAKIERYRRIIDPLTDTVTRKRVTKLIEDLQVARAKLHSEKEK
jgi:hypothetical protein